MLHYSFLSYPLTCLIYVYRQCEYEIDELKANINRDTADHQTRLALLEDKVIFNSVLLSSLSSSDNGWLWASIAAEWHQ